MIARKEEAAQLGTVDPIDGQRAGLRGKRNGAIDIGILGSRDDQRDIVKMLGAEIRRAMLAVSGRDPGAKARVVVRRADDGDPRAGSQ